ncbi:MAG TPA: hypothetical protein ENF93_02075 [Ignisphaera sp.]|nr:hypothetical protein [Ignisphaera sp.]
MTIGKGISEYIGVSIVVVAMVLMSILAIEWTRTLHEEYSRAMEEIEQGKEILYIYRNSSSLIIANEWGKPSDIIAILYLYPSPNYTYNLNCGDIEIVESMGIAIQRINHTIADSLAEIPLNSCLAVNASRICIVTIYGNIFCSPLLGIGIEDPNLSKNSSVETCNSIEALALLSRLLPPDHYAYIVSKYCIKNFSIIKPFQSGVVDGEFDYYMSNEELTHPISLSLINTTSYDYNTNGNHSGCVPLFDGRACIGWKLDTLYVMDISNYTTYTIYRIDVESILNIHIAANDSKYTLLIYFDTGLSPSPHIPSASAYCNLPSYLCEISYDITNHSFIRSPSPSEWIYVGNYDKYVITKEFKGIDSIELYGIYKVRNGYEAVLKLSYIHGLDFFDSSTSSLGYVIVFLLEEK